MSKGPLLRSHGYVADMSDKWMIWRVVGTASLLATGILCYLTASPIVAAAVGAPSKVPHCRVDQIRETLVPIKVSEVSPQSYAAWATFTNIGGTCNVPATYVSIEAMSGSSPLAASVVPADLRVGNDFLHTGDSVRVRIVVERTEGPAFGKGCDPKAADSLAVLPVYRGWPKRIFDLLSPISVCTGNDDNLGGGWLQ